MAELAGAPVERTHEPLLLRIAWLIGAEREKRAADPRETGDRDYPEDQRPVLPAPNEPIYNGRYGKRRCPADDAIGEHSPADSVAIGRRWGGMRAVARGTGKTESD